LKIAEVLKEKGGGGAFTAFVRGEIIVPEKKGSKSTPTS